MLIRISSASTRPLVAENKWPHSSNNSEHSKPGHPCGRHEYNGKNGSPTSVQAELMRLVKDYPFWTRQAVNWFTPLSMHRPTPRCPSSFGGPTATPPWPIFRFSAAIPRGGYFVICGNQFGDEDSVDFRGLPTHSAAGREGTLANSNQRASKGFTSTFPMPRDFGGVVRRKLD